VAKNSELNLDALTDEQHREFSQVFLSTWMRNGFGGLSKKDTELLIFACLDRALGGSRVVKNVEWAQTLRITTARVKALRLESHMRYADLFGPRQAFGHVNRFFESIESLTIDLDPSDPSLEGQVRLLLEDAVVKFETEEAIKAIGGIPGYERNREVLLVSLEHFLQLVAMAAKTGEEDLIVDLAVRLRDDEKARESVAKELKKAKYKQQTEGEKLKRGLRGMAEAVLGQKVKLFDELETIIGSQKYHGTFRSPEKK